MDAQTRHDIKEAFLAGLLCTKAVDPDTGNVGLHPVMDVMQHASGHKKMVRITLVDGRSGDFTEDHSVFFLVDGQIQPVKACQVTPFTPLVVVGENHLAVVQVETVRGIKTQQFTYDLSVPGPENFRLANGILAHNSYSIGGISLDIEKSSKYESLKSNAEGQFDKAAEAKARTVKWIRGLQQPRFGVGIRSAFGPFTGRGIMSPRNFL